MSFLGDPGPMACPFHDDHRMSATLYPGDEGFHCHGCGAHAMSGLDLVQQIYFPDEPFAIGRSLAKALVSHRDFRLPTAGAARPKRQAPSRSAVMAMTIFNRYCAEALADSPLLDRVRNERGLQDPVALGLGLSHPTMLKRLWAHLAELGHDQDEIHEMLDEAGVWRKPKPDRPGAYRLGRRLIVPEIRQGETVYYQARATGQDDIKYLNPPVAKPLFGYESLGQDLVIVGEGPFDVLPFIEHERSSLAILGAASADAAQIAALTEGATVVIGLDNDEAGLTRSQSLKEELSELGADAVIIPPPIRYSDYGEWAAKEGPEAVLHEIEWSIP